MKRFAIAVFAIFALAPAASQASSDLATQLSVARVQAAAAKIATHMNLINWKVGDSASYTMSAFGMPIGSMDESVDREEGNTLWLKEMTTITLLGQNMEVDAQIDRSNGKILKMMQNGQEVDVPTEQPEITSSEATTITVAAGTFDCLHITAVVQSQNVELWINPIDTVMDGMLKTVTAMQGIEITEELQSFSHGL